VIQLHKPIPCCKTCNTPEVVDGYEKFGNAYEKLSGNKVVLCSRLSEVEFICTKCAWCRPDPILEHDGTTKLWYQSCDKCKERHITTELGKCAKCDLGLF